MPSRRVASSHPRYGVTGFSVRCSAAQARSALRHNVGKRHHCGRPAGALNAVRQWPRTILDGCSTAVGPDLSSFAGIAGIKVVAGGLSAGTRSSAAFPLTFSSRHHQLTEALATAIAKAITPPKVTARPRPLCRVPRWPPLRRYQPRRLKRSPCRPPPTVKVARPGGDTAAPTRATPPRALQADGRHQFRHRASAGTSAKTGTPTSGPKHRAPTGNGANSTAAGSHDPGTNGSTGTHSTATKRQARQEVAAGS